VRLTRQQKHKLPIDGGWRNLRFFPIKFYGFGKIIESIGFKA